MNGSERASEDPGGTDLWFLGPKLERPRPLVDDDPALHEPFAAPMMGTEVPEPLAFGQPADAGPSPAPGAPPTRSSAPVNKFATVLPPLEDLPLDHDDADELIAGLLEPEPAVTGPRSIYALLGALLAVLALVAVALALHPWAHAAVHAH